MSDCAAMQLWLVARASENSTHKVFGSHPWVANAWAIVEMGGGGGGPRRPLPPSSLIISPSGCANDSLLTAGCEQVQWHDVWLWANRMSLALCLKCYTPGCCQHSNWKVLVEVSN